jgi:uncharacterized membrane protein YbhN (UPF0104 family)
VVEAGGTPDPAADVSISAGRLSRGRAIAGGLVILAALATAAYAVFRQRQSFAHSLDVIGWEPLVGALALALVGVAATGPVWLALLDGFGVHFDWREGSSVYFVTQLGKYLPGSVWPVLMQMEAGRRRGASRRAMLAANALSVLLSCVVGLVLACMLLPLSGSGALERYWLGLVAVPFLLAALHPRVIPAILDRAFALLRRPRLDLRLDGGAEVRAAAWSLASWAAQGMTVAVLCIGLGHDKGESLLLGVGGMALAAPLGILFIPAPAGAGIRDVVLALVLEATLPSGQALAVVLTARGLFIVSDVVLAGVSALTAGARRSAQVDRQPTGYPPGRRR